MGLLPTAFMVLVSSSVQSVAYQTPVDPLSCVGSQPGWLPCTGTGRCRSPVQSLCVMNRPLQVCTCERSVYMRDQQAAQQVPE